MNGNVKHFGGVAPENRKVAKAIVSRVLRRYEITLEDAREEGRANPAAQARRIACYLLGKAGLTLHEIGSVFDRPGSSVVSMQDTVEARLSHSPRLRELVRELGA